MQLIQRIGSLLTLRRLFTQINLPVLGDQNVSELMQQVFLASFGKLYSLYKSKHVRYRLSICHVGEHSYENRLCAYASRNSRWRAHNRVCLSCVLMLGVIGRAVEDHSNSRRKPARYRGTTVGYNLSQLA